ncbi:MAG: PAS domain S-box protein [Betaproteobacteria bacterium]|nr:PAS domain S-box protein [Betaproteobacteria bacterium]
MFASFRSQLVALMAIAVLGAVVVIATGHVERADAAYRRAQVATQFRADEIVREAGEVAALAREVVAYAARRAGRQALVEGQCDPELVAVSDAIPDIGNIAFIDRTGRLVCSVIAVPPEGLSLARAPWFAPALAAGAPRVSGAVYGPLYQRWVAVFTYPVRDPRGDIAGVAALAVDLSRFSALVTESPVAEGGFAAIVDGAGKLVAGMPPEPDAVGKPARDELLLAVEPGTQDLPAATKRAAGAEWIAAVKPIGGTGWHAVVVMSERAALADAAAQSRRIAANVVALFVVIAAVLAWIVARLVKPMELLAEAARSAAAGGKNVRAQVAGPSEVRAIAARFNDLLEARDAAEDGLRESESRYRDVIQNSPDAIVIVDPDSGIFVEANARAEEFYGMSREALLRSGPAALSPPVQPDGRDSGEAARRWIGMCVAGGRPVFEWMHLDAAGHAIDCEVRLVPMQLAGRTHARGSIVDIRDRKRADERLARLARLYAALSHTNEALVRADDPAALYADICRIAVVDGGIRMAWIGLVDEASGQVVREAWHGQAGGYFEGLCISVDAGRAEGRGATGTAIRERRNVVFNEYEAEPSTAPWRERARAAGFRALAAVPLVREGRAIGTLNLHAGEPDFFDDEMVGLLDEMAKDIAFALDKMESDAQRERAVVALVASESRLREVLETVPLVAVSLDTQARVTFCNDALLRLTGWPREEVIGVDWFSRFIGATDTAVRDLFRKAVATGELLQHYENEILTRAGERRLVRWSNTLIHADGRIVGATSLGEDVTVRREAEEALRESEARFRSLIDGVPSIPVQGYGRDRRVVFWNAASERLYGFTAAEAAGRRLEDLLFPVEARDAIVTACDAWLEGGPAVPAGEFRLVRKDGTTVEVFTSPVIVPNIRGEPEIYCIDVDLTELHRAQAALREGEERFRSVVAGLSEGVMLFDLEGRLLLCNDAAERMLGAPAEAMLGSEVLSADWTWDAMREDGSPFPVEEMPLTVAVRSGDFRSNVVMGIAPMGRRRIWIEVSARKIPGPGGAGAVLVSFSDVTKRHAAEQEVRSMNLVLERRVAARTAELETANRELESFSYSISHDLRTPLRAIDGYSAVVMDEEGERVSPGSQELLGRIRTAAARMARMIDDLLNLAYIGRAEIERKEVDLSHVVAELAAELSRKDPGRRCEWIVAPGLRASGDEGLLRNILENLLENAWRYTSRREHARIEFGMRTDPAGRQVFFVKDNGAGFDLAHAHKLFGAFQRLHADREFPGHGIGLATVRRIVQRHGGRVWADGTVGEGATFYFTLGVAPAAPGASP